MKKVNCPKCKTLMEWIGGVSGHWKCNNKECNHIEHVLFCDWL